MKRTKLVYVTAYAVGQAYGGPEEGGWYYDVGEPVDAPDARAKVPARIATRVAQTIAARYPHTSKRYSVLQGEDFDVRIEDEAPRAFPCIRPVYS